jgi:hypothetical protein
MTDEPGPEASSEASGEVGAERVADQPVTSARPQRILHGARRVAICLASGGVGFTVLTPPSGLPVGQRAGLGASVGAAIAVWLWLVPWFGRLTALAVLSLALGLFAGTTALIAGYAAVQTLDLALGIGLLPWAVAALIGPPWWLVNSRHRAAGLFRAIRDIRAR